MMCFEETAVTQRPKARRIEAVWRAANDNSPKVLSSPVTRRDDLEACRATLFSGGN